MNELIKTFKSSEVELEYMLTEKNNAEMIMFVHGAGMNLRQFVDQHEYFSDQFNVLSVSLRGHGLSKNPTKQTVENYSLEKNRDDLMELLVYLDTEKIHFVGNSAGGILGFYIHEANPNLLKSITTFGTVGELTYSTFLTNMISGIDKVMLKVLPKHYLKFLSKNTSKNETVQKEIFDMFKMSMKAVPYLRANLGNYSCLHTIENSNIPYLLIQGEQDTEVNRYLASTYKAIEANDNAQIIKLVDAGHIANMDNPNVFNITLENFINEIK